MPWTAPRTWITGETLTSGNLNTHLRDNLLSLHDNRVSALPGTPADQDEVRYVADATKRILWPFKYNSGGLAGRSWEGLGTGGLGIESIDDASSSATNGTAYVDFSPSLSVTAPLAGDYIAVFGVRAYIPGGSESLYVSPKYGAGATADVDGCRGFGALAGQGSIHTLAAGDAVKLQYRQSVGTAGGTFSGKWLRLLPVRVG